MHALAAHLSKNLHRYLSSYFFPVPYIFSSIGSFFTYLTCTSSLSPPLLVTYLKDFSPLLTLMAKKVAKSPTSRNTTHSEASGEIMAGFITNLLDTRDSHQSDMKTEKLEEIRLLFPYFADVMVPDSTDRADFYKKNWVSFYYYPFDIVSLFPFLPIHCRCA